MFGPKKPKVVQPRHGGVRDDGRPVLAFWRRALVDVYTRYLAWQMKRNGHHRAARIMRQHTCEQPSRAALLKARDAFIGRWPD